MFFLFVDTSDVEQIDLQLSLESMQCHLLLTYLLTTYPVYQLRPGILTCENWGGVNLGSDKIMGPRHPLAVRYNRHRMKHNLPSWP